MKPSIPRLQVITDEVLQTKFSHEELTRLVVKGGGDGIQFREKRDMSSEALDATVASMKRICDHNSVTLIVNDYVDVSIRTGCGAIHLGRTDESITVARQRVGKDVVIGGTANSLAEAKLVSAFDVDYIGVGPVFGTSSKPAPASRLGLDGLRLICDAVDKPVVAIGNMRVQNVHECFDAGIYGIAVLSAVVCSEDIAAATSEFMSAIEAAL